MINRLHSISNLMDSKIAGPLYRQVDRLMPNDWFAIEELILGGLRGLRLDRTLLGDTNNVWVRLNELLKEGRNDRD